VETRHTKSVRSVEARQNIQHSLGPSGVICCWLITSVRALLASCHLASHNLPHVGTQERGDGWLFRPQQGTNASDELARLHPLPGSRCNL
jgi:hypothetical protein